MKTLIIDRARLFQETVAKSQHDSGIDAFYADSSEQALQMLNENMFEYIYLLLDLEDSDDLELYKILKRDHNFQHATVVLLPTQNRAGLIEDIITSATRHVSDKLPAEDAAEVAAHINITSSDTMEKQLRKFVHDYNNTFGIIGGYADLLLPLLEDKSDLGTFAERIIQASKDGLSLTDRLLEFASSKTKNCC